ncbi:MAG: kinase, partial [Candidatus Bathyarchaeia archaeon]
EFKNRPDLASFFVEKYVECSGDSELPALLPFYKCYRAYVRGKVLSFKLNDPNISVQEKRAAAKEAKAYFKLAGVYAKSL